MQSLKLPDGADEAEDSVDVLADELDLEREDVRGGRTLQFLADADVQRRFQRFHDQQSLAAARWGVPGSLSMLAVLQAGCWTRRQLAPDRRGSPVEYAALLGTLGLLAVWSGLLVRWGRCGDVDGQLQRLLAALAVCVVLVVLATPGFSTRDSAAAAATDTDDADGDAEALELSQLALFELMALLAVADSWGVQFPAFCLSAAVSALGSACWWASASPLALAHEWHVLALFLGSLVALGACVYHRERQARSQFLRLWRLRVENAALTRQTSVLQRRVDAVDPSRTRTSSNSSRASSLSSPKCSMAAPAALGESWMENVLKTLVALKRALGEQQTGADAVRQLEFVIQALTGEHDLFLANSGGSGSGSRSPPSISRRRSLAAKSTPPLDCVDAGGWLSLLTADPRQRRRLSSDVASVSPRSGALQRQATFPPSASPRHADPDLLQSVLSQVDSYFTDGGTSGKSHGRRLSLSTQWSAVALVRRAASADEADLFALAASCALPLSALLLTAIESHSLFLRLPLRVDSAAAFAREVERRYRPKNPYHNALHAASVVWDVNFFLRRLERPALSALQILSALVAAAVHDVNHPGVNNAFLVASSSPLAVQYSDDSVLERMHLAECFQACAQDGCDVFEGLSRDQKRQSRQLIIAMVLATDLSGHVQHVNRLKTKSIALQAAGDQAAAVPVDLALTSIIMMADLGHAFKSFEAHRAWSQRVTDEFWAQGDAERQLQLPVSPLCDRQRAAGKFEASQVGFLEFVVLPLCLAVRDVVPLREFDRVVAQIRRNADEWRQRAGLRGRGAEPACAAAAATELRQASSV